MSIKVKTIFADRLQRKDQHWWCATSKILPFKH